MLKNLSRLFTGNNLATINSFHSSSFFGPQVTTTDLSKSFKNVLNSPDLKDLTKNLESIVTGKPEYSKISEKILQSHDNRPVFPSDSKRLKRKLNVKLAWIILSLRRLTSACDNDFLCDETKLDLIKSSLVHRIKNKSIDEIERELEILDILDLDEGQEEYEDSFYEIEETTGLDSFLKAYGVLKTESDIIDYKEDIVKSVGKDIEAKANELRLDFPGIDRHLHELQFLVTTEWLADYKDRYLESQINEFDFGWENEDGDPEWVCP